MYKILGVVWTIALGGALAVTQEELAQYVAQQQTHSLGGGPLGGPARRQAFLYQPQAKSLAQSQPTQQVYQFQPKAAPAYQFSGGQAASEQQYYQPAVQVQQAQPQPQQYYQPRPQPPQKKLVRPQAGQQLDDNQQSLEEYGPAQPYQFGFDINDDEFTNYQNRKEQREGDKISGSYSVVDSDGFIRTVTYTADPLEGFKADVVREPTDIKIKIPQPNIQDSLGGQGLARKQQTQQYLQAAQPKQQYALRPEHTQVLPRGQGQPLRQYSPVQYQQQYEQ